MTDRTPSTRDKILEAAEALFARRGFAGVGMREVATEVGVGKSTLFHHFRSKTQLYQQVLIRVLGRIRERVEPALKGAPGSAQKLEVWLDALIDALADHPTTARLLLRGLFEEEVFVREDNEDTRAVEASLAAVIDGFQQLLREGIRDGAFRDQSVADATQSMIGVAVYHFASGEFGEALTGSPIYSAEAVRRRKREARIFVRQGLAEPQHGPSGPDIPAISSRRREP